MTTLLDEGALDISPIIYEDFLPVSAAGIFQSNLGDEKAQSGQSQSSLAQFVDALGADPADEFDLYAAIQEASLKKALGQVA